jgi:hypothetical protein
VDSRADERRAPARDAPLSGAVSPTGRRKDRPLEWFLAGFSLCWGVAGAVFRVGAVPQASAQPGFHQTDWIAAASVLGVAHMVALLINGTMSWTPALRLATTSLNAGFFAWSAAALLGMQAGPMALVCAYVTFGFLWCAYVAGLDVARMRLGTYGD